MENPLLKQYEYIYKQVTCQYVTGPNIALGKPTDQYPGVLHYGASAKAVDGVKKTVGMPLTAPTRNRVT